MNWHPAKYQVEQKAQPDAQKNCTPESLLTAIAALGNVVRKDSSYYLFNACHWRMIAEARSLTINILSPEFNDPDSKL
jgi:hypothetical protein